jgi:putative hydrolase of the HAD superfamily
MIKAILFDIDNTLIDFMKMKKKSCESAVDAMISAGLDMKKEDVMKEIYEIYDTHGMEYQKIFQKLLKKLKGKVDYRILSYGIIAYRKTRENYLVPYSGVIPVLKSLKKKDKLGIVSDAPSMQAWMRLIAVKIDGFFDVVVTKGDVKRQKTSAVPFNSALKQLKMKPEEVLMVGDRITRDILTPKKLGMKTCFARYGVEKPPESGKSEADFEIDDIQELLEVVK